MECPVVSLDFVHPSCLKVTASRVSLLVLLLICATSVNNANLSKDGLGTSLQ